MRRAPFPGVETPGFITAALRAFGTLLLLALLAPAARAADDFPPVTDEEKAVTSVPGEPNAPAVVLFKKGELLMNGYGLQTGATLSYLHVQVRLKILTDEGRGNGEIAISHGDGARLQHFQGRTVLPDGRIVPVPEDARFVRRTSRSGGTFVTAVAFPAVAAGAILDYRYDLSYDSLFVVEPWYFSEDIPVRHSEVVFKTSPQLQVIVWSRSSQQEKIEVSTEKNASGYITRGWADNLAAVPDEPYGPPYNDAAAQMLLLPTAMTDGWKNLHLFESWPRVCEIFDASYDRIRRRNGAAEKTAREVAGTGGPRQRAEALYRFVRDQIVTVPSSGIDVGKVPLDGVLAGRQGGTAEKALLLQAMLKAVGIDSRLVWAGDRRRGRIDIKLPDPNWFDTVLVRADLDGGKVFLDPSDRALAFGRLRPGYERTPALLFDPKKPEEIQLPEAPADQNLRRADIDLALDAGGRLTGQGVLKLTGHPAWERIGWKGDEAKTLQAWTDWLAERFRDFQISGVKVDESPGDGRVSVTWGMTQRPGEVLGDESALLPSAPLGPLVQPFVQPAVSRRTPVMLDYPSREEVELRLRWPEGWKMADLPPDKGLVTPAGRLTTGLEVREGERRLVFRRQLDLTRREFTGSQDYESLRAFFGEVEKQDAQKLVLVKK